MKYNAIKNQKIENVNNKIILKLYEKYKIM